MQTTLNAYIINNLKLHWINAEALVGRSVSVHPPRMNFVFEMECLRAQYNRIGGWNVVRMAANSYGGSSHGDMLRAIITQWFSTLISVLKQIECERILGNDMDSCLWFLLCTSYGGTAASNEIRAGKTLPWTSKSLRGQTAIWVGHDGIWLRCRGLCLGLSARFYWNCIKYCQFVVTHFPFSHMCIGSHKGVALAENVPQMSSWNQKNKNSSGCGKVQRPNQTWLTIDLCNMTTTLHSYSDVNTSKAVLAQKEKGLLDLKWKFLT
jgi:hypothetical protein